MGRRFQVSRDKLVYVQGFGFMPPCGDREMGRRFQESRDKLVPVPGFGLGLFVWLER